MFDVGYDVNMTTSMMNEMSTVDVQWIRRHAGTRQLREEAQCVLESRGLVFPVRDIHCWL